MNRLIKQKISLSSEAQIAVDVDDVLTPDTIMATTPSVVKRLFLSHLFNQKKEDKVVVAVSVGDVVKAGDNLIFYPRSFVRLFFAIEAFFSDEEREKSSYITQFLRQSKHQKRWWFSFLIPALKSRYDGVVELVSLEGNIMVIKREEGTLSLQTNTYGKVASITNNRIEIASFGTLLTAGFGYGPRVSGLLQSESNENAPLFLEKGTLDRESLLALLNSERRGVIANAITFDAVELLVTPGFSPNCSIIAFSIVKDISSSKDGVKMRDFRKDNLAVTLLPHSHPQYGVHASALLIHGEER
ncbi:hypothetical protein KAH37_06940 [bacterium]|nr:hypothetical protein [bacterium]